MWSFVSISFESWMTDFKEYWISLEIIQAVRVPVRNSLQVFQCSE